jgi:hypothetical protein
MKRATIAAAWVAGTTIPSLLAAAFLFGCCVLPFHHVMHKVMPVCHTAIAMLTPHADDTPAAPAKAKQEPVKRIVTVAPQSQRVTISATATASTPQASTAYRSFIAHGALRCDRDVGLHVLDDAFLI